MKRTWIMFFLIAGACTFMYPQEPATNVNQSEFSSIRLPSQVMPQLGCWFWRGAELEEDGYKHFLDINGAHAPFSLLTTSFRIHEREITEPHFHDQIGKATAYAKEKGISLVVDLDLRLARRAFQARYPGEMQEMLILKEIEYDGKREAEVSIHSLYLNDHYTHRTTPYISLGGDAERVYEYIKTEEGIDGTSLRDITNECQIVSSCPDSILVSLPGDSKHTSTHACVMVTFTHLAADVFAPHLASFQRELIQQYADIPLAGVCKDEWGFPPCFHHPFNEFWYSDHRAKAYTARTGGRELLEDCLLMYVGIKGRERERQRAINHFRVMSWERNAELEDDFYHTVKEVFGPEAIVATHPTWYPFPGFREYKKNGLHWWAATRDWAQTDELTPFGVRTALAKKWDSPVWYNMFYSETIKEYERSVWSHALGGGRINYHPVYPDNGTYRDRDVEVFRGDLMKAECRVRLLNYISKSPLDCPVAVIFGHARTMNWAGPAYDDVGMELVDSLWREGYPADLIPSTEIKHLRIDNEGWIKYGKQRYAAVVLYYPEYENQSLADFFNKASTGKTQLFRMGDWTMDFDARKIDGNDILPQIMKASGDVRQILTWIRMAMDNKGIQRQARATSLLEGFHHESSAPPATGHCRLLDGTLIQVAGTYRVSGDPIFTEMTLQGRQVNFDATGVAAVRMDKEGHVQALAAGGLNWFSGGDLEIRLREPIDLAMWKNQIGKWEGVVQGWSGELPPELSSLSENWARLDLPDPLED